MAGLFWTRGSVRASTIRRGSPRLTTNWQKEWLSGVLRMSQEGEGRPIWLLKNCRVESTSETRQTSALSVLPQ